MVKKSIIGASLLACLAGCNIADSEPYVDNFDKQVKNYFSALRAIDEERINGISGTCNFESAIDLDNYLRERINDRIAEIVDIYNKKFGLYLSANDANVEYRYFEDPIGNYPHFYYSFENHKLILEMLPENNHDEYVKSMCLERDKIWRLYYDFTVGFVPHELAHLYHDQFMMHNGINWGKISESSPRIYGAGLVAEGVAMYVASTIDPTESIYKKEEYANPYENLMTDKPWNIWIYPAGEKFVRSILDVDFESGLGLLSRNLPEPRNANDIYRYQSRMLKKLNR